MDCDFGAFFERSAKHSLHLPGKYGMQLINFGRKQDIILMAKREKCAIISIKFLFAWTIWHTKKQPQHLLIALQEKTTAFCNGSG
jgi:hypothetical protein